MLRLKLLATLLTTMMVVFSVADDLAKSAIAVRSSTVIVEVREKGAQTYRLAGTGWLYKYQNVIVTAAHVLTPDAKEKPYDSFKVQFSDGAELTARVSDVYLNAKDDVAIIKLPATVKQRTPLNLAPSSPVFGDLVFTVGHSWSYYRFQLSVGRLANDLHPTRTINTAHVAPGNSGGALCNEQGQVVGMQVAVDPDDMSISFAVKLETLRIQIAEGLKKLKIE